MSAAHVKPPPRLLNNTVWALVGEAATLLAGSGAFFLLVDRLGPLQAGYYGVITALAVFSVPLASVGVQSLLMREASQGIDFDESWSRSVATIVLVGGLVTIVTALLIQPWLLPEVGQLPFALIFLTQAVLRAVVEFGVIAAQAHRRMQVGAGVRVLAGVAQLGAVSLFAAFGDATIRSWSLFAVSGMTVSAATSLVVVYRSFGATPWGTRPTAASLRDGVPYALGNSSARVLDSIDRPMLVRLGPTATDAGFYNVGYRLIQMSMMPLAALVRASVADFFDAGLDGRKAALRVAQRLTVRAAAFGVAVGIGLFVFAPLVPWMLGEEWTEVVDVLRYLALLPLIKGVQVFPANALTGSGHQASRNRTVLLGIAVNVVANLALIPEYGWRGAAIATLVAEAAMSMALWWSLTRPGAARAGASRT